MLSESANLQEIFGKTVQGSTKSFTPSQAAKMNPFANLAKAQNPWLP